MWYVQAVGNILASVDWKNRVATIRQSSNPEVSMMLLVNGKYIKILKEGGG